MNQRPWYRRFERLIFRYAVSGLFAILILSTGFKAFSQSYFYFENKLPVSKDSVLTYYTFLTLFNNGSGVARMRYIEPVSGENRLVEINLRDSAGTRGEQKHFLIQNGDVLPIEGENASGYLSPKFVFKQQMEGTDTFYVPDGIMYLLPDGSWQLSEMLVQQEKSYGQLKKEKDLVSVFYNQSDDFYRMLYALRATPRDPQKRKEKFYLIAVANTMDSTIGVSTQRDLTNVINTFTLLATDLNMDISIQRIADDKFSKKAVDLAVANLRPSPLDIVVFYYSGHGFRYSNDKSDYPRMSLRNSRALDLDRNNLSIEAVYKSLVKKKARVTLVLSDCCNDDIGAMVPFGEDMIIVKSAPGPKPFVNIALCNRLFFPPKPVAILIGSADRYQLAVGSPRLGGYFTNSFAVELKKNVYNITSKATWTSILANSKTQASWLSLGAECGPNRCVQSARFVISP